MVAAGRVLLWAIVGVYDEMLLLLRANVVWFLVSALLGTPVFLLVAFAMPVGSTEPEAGGLLLPATLAGFLLLLVPNPASLGLHRLAALMHREESPPWSQFWTAARRSVRLGLALYAIGLLGVVVLGVNSVFYLRAEQGPLQALSLVWLYLLLFWLALQLYLGPLVMLLDERRVLALYRRAAMLVLAQPLYTITLLLATALLMPLSILVVPLYPCAAMAFVALASTRALGQLKRRYDPEPDADEEAA